ncbi:MAG TPA: DUF3311 domain-containing protein [Candidatus Polarisedimenticolia bacterium]|nr:DUF3311 domain-containing protein [Candidatus Polarisedimenticolia bacterium]
MSPSSKRRLALAGLPALYLLHNDFWLWDDRREVLGLPAGLAYHVAYCLLASLLLWAVVRYAWPSHLSADGDGGDPT